MVAVCVFNMYVKGIEELIKYHDFPKEGTLSVTRLTAVRDSVEEGSEKNKKVVM